MIYVKVPSEPAIAHGLVMKAIAIWDQAQSWFGAKYFPGRGIYTFVIGNGHPLVTVEFADYWTVSNYCPSVTLGVDGCTHIRWDDSKNITSAVVFLDTSFLTYQGSKYTPLFLALHELGHALGLTDFPASLSCPFQDLLCMYYPDEFPSTLDLYALHQLALGNKESEVFLPSNVPYAYFTSSLKGLTSPVMPSPQGDESQSISRYALAAMVTTGWIILLWINLKKRRET